MGSAEVTYLAKPPARFSLKLKGMVNRMDFVAGEITIVPDSVVPKLEAMNDERDVPIFKIRKRKPKPVEETAPVAPSVDEQTDVFRKHKKHKKA